MTTPEARAREKIGEQLYACSGVVPDRIDFNFHFTLVYLNSHKIPTDYEVFWKA